EHAIVHGFLDAFFDRRNIFLRDGTTDQLVLEDEALPGRQRLEFHDTVAVLPLTARLPDKASLGFDRSGNGFPVRDLWATDVRHYLEFAQHPVHEHFEVKLAHAVDQGLASLRIGTNLEGWV